MWKLKLDGYIALVEECSGVIQRKLPRKLTDPCRFTIPYSIGSLPISHSLCDLAEIINLMLLSMIRKLNYSVPKPTQMTLTPVDRSITYPYKVLEYVLVTIDGLLFPVDFIVLDMLEDYEAPLLLRRSFLVTCKALIGITLWELIFMFNREKVIFNVFEAMKHQKENCQHCQVNMMKEIFEGHHGKNWWEKNFR